MFKLGLGLVCLILAVGSIDGPTGHELNNWGQCFAFAFAGIALCLWGLMTGAVAVSYTHLTLPTICSV